MRLPHIRLSYSQLVLNGLSVFFVIYIASTLWHRFEGARPHIPAAIQPGRYLTGTALDPKWSQDETTTLLFLSTDCHFCNASMPFYKELLSRAVGHTHLIAFFPQTVVEAREHLAKYQVPISDVRQVDFYKTGISGTPTLVIANRSSKIDTTYVGTLTPDEQKEVQVRLGLITSSTPELQHTVTGPKLATLLSDSHTQIVDVRERPDFNTEHIKGALDMPVDEIEARASHELAPTQPVVLYCKYCGPCERAMHEADNQSLCVVSSQILRHEIGSSQISIVTDDLTQLAKDHISIESTR